MASGGQGVLAWLFAAALVTVAWAPTGGAHTAEEPLSIEAQLLQDEGEDTFYWYDGYDLWTLFVREAHWQATGQDGLIFRFTLYGGFAPQPTAEALHIDIGLTTPSGEHVLRLTTPDDQNWTGDLTIVAQNVTQDEPPFTGVTAKLQAFVPHEQLGLTLGDTVHEVWMASYADEDLRDRAPGGWYLPGSQGEGEIPAESQRPTESITVQGPVGYVNWAATVDGSEVSFELENPLTASGQHVGLEPVDTPGWAVDSIGAPGLSLDEGEAGTVRLTVTAAPEASAPLPIEILTDLGGRTTAYVGINGSQLQVASTPDGLDVAPEQPANESPAAGLLALLGALAAAGVVAARTGRRS